MTPAAVAARHVLGHMLPCTIFAALVQAIQRGAPCLFGSFFTAYFFVRGVNNAPHWPPEGFHLPVAAGGDGTGNAQRRRQHRTFRRGMQFRQPHDVEAPTLSGVDLRQPLGLRDREVLALRIDAALAGVPRAGCG